MASLDRTLRRGLENTVKQARRVAEAGARKAVEQLAVHYHEPWPSMSPGQRQLRNRLRAHGRQLGDLRDDKRGAQSIDRLVGECAYEHWHRMLFARFLAENELLIEPGHGVAISLEDCRELARAQGQDWLDLASSYAVRMLPQIFRADDPVLELNLPPESRSELEDLLKGLPREVFLADDSLGWVYQFWQAEQKDAVNKSEKKIGAEELPAVTQLFTEDYMVEFLLHNTLGAWWAGKALAANPDLVKNARGEDELRAACAVGDVRWTYLRFVQDEDGSWRPAAGTFSHWPAKTAELKVLDPCCGSGHFLVFALPILTAMRMAEEGLSARDACDAVLRDNLFGLELDQRCTQIAAFNLALAAWTFEGTGYRPLPRLHVACTGLAVGCTKEQWLALAEGKRDLTFVLAWLYQTFQDAPTLGSLLNPSMDLILAQARMTSMDVRELLNKAFARFERETDVEMSEIGVAARGFLEAADFLARDYHLIVTNVPYIARGKQSEKLRNFADHHYPDARQDLATFFLRRCIELCTPGGTVASVTPQNWLFLNSYSRMREILLRNNEFNVIARLGTGAFETISGAVVNVALCIFSGAVPVNDHVFAGFDALTQRGVREKTEGLARTTPRILVQSEQLKNPDATISFEESASTVRLAHYARCNQGIGTADTGRYIVRSWELPCITNQTWAPYQMAPSNSNLVSGCHSALRWQEGRGILTSSPQARVCGQPAWGKVGVAVAVTSELYRSLYLGGLFDCTLGAITSIADEHRIPVLTFLLDNNLPSAVRAVDQALSVTESSFLKVPFDIEHWKRVAAAVYPDGLPKPNSRDPLQWVFNGHPAGSDQPLHVAVARLLGYQWPRQTGSSFPDCPALGPDGLERLADEDGIVCLSATKGEAPAAARLRALLATAFGSEWSAGKERELLTAASSKKTTLEDWLLDEFFEQHSALFHHRPFVWHLWDGRRDGFNVLVNYHRLAAPNGEGRRTLEKLIYTYLGDWITQQRRDQQAGVEGADARLAAALHLQEELKKILDGEPPYDIFVRWKPLHEQAIGWDPDINDGVRLNIRPFMTARPLYAKAKYACILRATPKSIKWDKDRGKEPERAKEDYPWFWGWDEKMQDFTGGKTFDGNRWNDVHYTNAFKQAARQRREGGV